VETDPFNQSNQPVLWKTSLGGCDTMWFTL